MALVSYGFGFFCAVLLLLYYIVPGRFQWRILLAASVLFYGFSGPLWILYPAASSVSVWYLARKIVSMTDQYRNWVQKEQPDRTQKKAYNQRLKARQKRFLILGLLLNFGILAVLKYTNFLLSNVEGILHLAGISGEMEYADWVLPLGISYYTFQSMGYLIDVYQRKYDPEKSLLRTALFVFYFPQLTVGPISRFDRLKEELYSPHRFSMDRLAAGGQRVLWGYFKKLVVADRIGPAASMITGSPEIYGGVYALLGIVGHVIQLYADFSGGIDIILGISEMFGIRLPENFDRPFSSRSLAEFWRRWHMTLMQWFREYIFFPVSTSQAARKLSAAAGRLAGKKAAGKVPVYLASLTVWSVTGIWHGASWNWVLWGLANCVFMLLSQELSGLFRSLQSRFPFTDGRGYQCFQKVRTFFVFCLPWMFIYYPAAEVFPRLLGILKGEGLLSLMLGGYGTLMDTPDLMILGLGVLFMALAGQICGNEGLKERLSRLPWPVSYGLSFVLFLILLVTGVYGRGYEASQFIYNRF